MPLISITSPSSLLPKFFEALIFDLKTSFEKEDKQRKNETQVIHYHFLSR
jgi:hypothetical protein